MSKKLTIKRVEVGSVAKFVGTVNAVVAVFIGLIASFSGILTIITSNEFGVWESFGLSIAVIAAGVLLYPLVMFFIGWLYGALAALIFNLFVGVSGGITVEVDEEK